MASSRPPLSKAEEEEAGMLQGTGGGRGGEASAVPDPQAGLSLRQEQLSTEWAALSGSPCQAWASWLLLVQCHGSDVAASPKPR